MRGYLLSSLPPVIAIVVSSQKTGHSIRSFPELTFSLAPIDAQCEAGLRCFQRGGMEAVPGCSGAGTKGWDYCLDPTARPDYYVAEVGNNKIPATAWPLEECAGDCDSDADCATGLICQQRSGGEPVPGCYGAIGEGISKSSDFCFDPSKTDAPTGSPSWSPTTGTPTVTRQFWSFDVYGTQAPIVDIREVEYDQNQVRGWWADANWRNRISVLF